MSTSPAASAQARRPQLAMNLATILVIAAMAALAFAYGIDASSRASKPLPRVDDSGPTLMVNIAGKELKVPRSWLRHPDDAQGGFVTRLEMAVALPVGAGGTMEKVTLTLLPRSQVRTSAALLDRVYLHEFAPEELEAPSGLIGKPLVNEGGFQDESVWYDPLSPEPFVAKCMTPIEAGEAGQCLRTVVIKDSLAGVYAFDQEVLDQWRGFDAAVRPWLARIGAL